MKVLELVLKWGNGGVERYIEDLVGASKAESIDCHVASVATNVASVQIDGYGPLVKDGVKGAIANGQSIVDFISNGSYDIVHIHGNNGLSFKFAHMAAQNGAKAIVHSHNSAFGDRSRRFKAIFTDIQRALYSKECAGMLACSKAAGDFLFANHPYQVALNGINTARFSFDEAKRLQTRARLGIPCGAPVVGFAASFIEAKNPFFALEAFKRLLGHCPEARFLVCGDGKLFDVFKDEARDLIASNRCVCVGRVPDIERYYCAMDVLLAPSKYEGLPINLVEAQASGLTVVASESITDEVVVVPELCTRLSLADGLNPWTAASEDALDTQRFRSAKYADVVAAAGFSQPECFRTVFDMYREVVG
ncbi:glycosyltransferase [Paratractidigestivibacter faecalis]|uniref:glycosyltransferase n=1 Tax=Paratractidigestivibacter faecalis TaxID=2292441 RepID=UPI003F9A2688